MEPIGHGTRNIVPRGYPTNATMAQTLKTYGIMAAIFAVVLVFVAQDNKLRASLQENQAWREASSPVFASRDTYNIKDHATPANLREYLDPARAIVWQEHSLAGNPPTDPRFLRVVSYDVRRQSYQQMPTSPLAAFLNDYRVIISDANGGHLVSMEDTQYEGIKSGYHRYNLFDTKGAILATIEAPEK